MSSTLINAFVLVCEFQAGQSSTVIENIHTIIAAAAVKFSFDQLTHLFVLIQKVSATASSAAVLSNMSHIVLTMTCLHIFLELGS